MDGGKIYFKELLKVVYVEFHLMARVQSTSAAATCPVLRSAIARFAGNIGLAGSHWMPFV